MKKNSHSMSEKKFKYSVLTYNIGGYEVLHELEYKDEDVEYIYVTDDRSITSSTWNVVYVENEHPEDNFDLCYQIRFHPFEYVSSDIVIRIDGSMGVCGNLDPIIDAFNKGGYELALEIHPTRADMKSEYIAWIQQRGYLLEQANKCLAYMAQVEGYNVNDYKGLYQYNFMIQRRNKVNEDINRMTYAVIKYLAPEGKQIERLDQTLGSFVINKYFNGLKVLPLSQAVCTSGTYFKWYAHNSNTVLNDAHQYNQPYLFNQPIDCLYVGE